MQMERVVPEGIHCQKRTGSVVLSEFAGTRGALGDRSDVRE